MFSRVAVAVAFPRHRVDGDVWFAYCCNSKQVWQTKAGRLLGGLVSGSRNVKVVTFGALSTAVAIDTAAACSLSLTVSVLLLLTLLLLLLLAALQSSLCVCVVSVECSVRVLPVDYTDSRWRCFNSDKLLETRRAYRRLRLLVDWQNCKTPANNCLQLSLLRPLVAM